MGYSPLGFQRYYQAEVGMQELEWLNHFEKEVGGRTPDSTVLTVAA